MARVPDLGQLTVNIKRRIAILDDGRICPITNFFVGPDETDDPFEATACVVKVDDDEWLTVDLASSTTVTTH